MPTFSKSSRAKLDTCHPSLIVVLEEAIKHYDFTITYGHRSNEEQAALYAQGRTTPGAIVTWAKPGESKHNSMPSLAVDVAPFFKEINGLDWNDEAAFARLAGFIQGIAATKGIKVRWGGDWDADGRTKDERKPDFPHVELVLE